MNKIQIKSLILIMLLAFTQKASASQACYSKVSEVLSCFIKHEDEAFNYEFISSEKSLDILIESYQLDSQKWPLKLYLDIPTTVWQHQMKFYIPNKVSHNKALLYISGGYNRNGDGLDEFVNSKERIDFAKIASDNEVVVIEIQDVPNQYLIFQGQARKEDQILAYTYKKVMEDPVENAYLAGHLPMAKSVIKAMDAAQGILKNEHTLNIEGFILSGASKRGWAVWLAALEDERVKAIIPMVIDILNTKQSIMHICGSYKGICPYALKDYKNEGITKTFASKAFEELMKIEDPFSYLGDEYFAKYKTRFAIPKYIINASGDDFFVPDSSRWYFKQLPGAHNYIRYIPNAAHYLTGNPIIDSTKSPESINSGLNAYLYFFLNNIKLPEISSEYNANNIEVSTSQKPDMVKLWVAHNEEERDFRLLNSYSYYNLFKKRIQAFFSMDICDNCYVEKQINFHCMVDDNCKITIPLPKHEKGWQASFAELHYNISNRTFVITTEVNIVPDNLPEAVEHAELTLD